MRKSGVCPKCGSKDLGVERDFRLPGREFLKIISCNKCKFVELYTIDNDKKEKRIRNGNIFLWSMMIIGFVIPISVVLLLVI